MTCSTSLLRRRETPPTIVSPPGFTHIYGLPVRNPGQGPVRIVAQGRPELRFLALRPGRPAIAADKFKDYRGVKCPLNFVKTKLDLEMMESGETLNILLDDGEPIENVPRSVQEEGHKILSQKMDGDYWSVIIEKAD